MMNFIVRKKDGNASYQLSSVMDDLHFGVDLIVRGADLFDSTLAQLFLADNLADDRFGKITFHHHPLLQGSDGAKLSKTAGAYSVRAMRASGKTPSDLLNLLVEIRDLGSTGYVY